MISGRRKTLHRLVLIGLLCWSGMGKCWAVTQEYRALWVDTWNEGILDPDSARLTVARAREHSFNALFVEVSKVMDAYYRSDLLPRGKNLKDPQFDPLGTVLHFAKPSHPDLQPIDRKSVV